MFNNFAGLFSYYFNLNCLLISEIEDTKNSKKLFNAEIKTSIKNLKNCHVLARIYYIRLKQDDIELLQINIIFKT